ncbi:Six-hairpin glycosidase-like protein [Tricladium varicosporioides]|nr:Six-hairpin glycosidase-like protein [Hymenoscyphus varicosporioides]
MITSPNKWNVSGDVDTSNGWKLVNGGNGKSEIVFDYERAVGGMPFIETEEIVSCNGEPVVVDIIFSETFEGLHKDTGDGPFFLFSNAMDTYRLHTQSFSPSSSLNKTTLPFAQRSQRYQRVVLRTANASISILSIGYAEMRPPNPTVNTFSCSNEKLNRIWKEGVRTVDMCTVEAGETAEAWEVTEEGTRIRGQHWAPCRQGTRWGDKTVTFEVKIEKGGASWGVHMVANGLILTLDAEKKALAAFEGLSNTNGVFPSIPRGQWNLSIPVPLNEWLLVKTVAKGSSISISINNTEVAIVNDLNCHPILGGSENNQGSVAFGGPSNYLSIYRFLEIVDGNGISLYKNEFKLADKVRTLADFQVGTNGLACTIDGAKRDRAVFGGDLFVMGRSIYYSTSNFEAALGSIKLLTSHQTKDGYLGNLCPIQAPVNELSDPPTYAFYSLSYALLLVVAIKDYWMFSGDDKIVKSVFKKLNNLVAFTERFVDARGLVVAPPPLSMDWFPMGGPIFGASGKINVAYYDALNAMSNMSVVAGTKDTFAARAEILKTSILANLWNEDAGIMRMSDMLSPTGVAQDINAYAITAGVVPSNPKAQSILSAPNGTHLPLAYQGLERWGDLKVVSPYASGFAAEALFEGNFGSSALDLISRVWGLMANESDPNYSGGHWEAMKPDGTPVTDDTSLMHGWSTWPVYLLPRYLGGIKPTEPGWSRCSVKPVLAGLEIVNVQLSTPNGTIKLCLKVQEKSIGTAEMVLRIPHGTIADVYPPEGWSIVDSDATSATHTSQSIAGTDEETLIRISRLPLPQTTPRTTGKSAEVDMIEEVTSESPTSLTMKQPSSFLRRLIRLFA